MNGGIVLALFAAACYGASDFIGGIGSRRAPAMSIVFLGQLAGAGTTVVAGLTGAGVPTADDAAWALLAGLGSAGGSIYLLRGLSRGRMALVAPTSAVGAAVLPVLVGLGSGDRPVPLVWLGLVLALPGIWLVSRQLDGSAGGAPGGVDRASLVDGALGGLGFGLMFVSLGQVPDSAGTLALAVTQLTGALVTLMAATSLRLPWRPTRQAASWGATSGLLGAGATLAFVTASHRVDLSTVAVLTSLYPAVTVLLARALVGERLTATQRAGLLVCSAAVGLIAAG